MATQKTKLGRWADSYVGRRSELLAARRAFRAWRRSSAAAALKAALTMTSVWEMPVLTAHDTSREITRDDLVSLRDAMAERYRKD